MRGGLIVPIIELYGFCLYRYDLRFKCDLELTSFKAPCDTRIESRAN